MTEMKGLLLVLAALVVVSSAASLRDGDFRFSKDPPQSDIYTDCSKDL